MKLVDFFQSITIVLAVLGTLLLLVHSFWPARSTYSKEETITINLQDFCSQGLDILKYSFISISRMPVTMLSFFLLYGFIFSFYYWYRQNDFSLALTLGLTIITTLVSLGALAVLLTPIIFITHKVLFDRVVELRIFRIAVYSVMVPFIYIFIIQDLTPGPLVEGIMLTGLLISFYFIFRGIIFCLQAPRTVFSQWWGNRFVPILMIISWLSVIIFNLFTMILLVSNTNPYSFVDNMGPVAEPLRLLYFTVITFTGVGYGDIVPRGNVAVFITIVISLSGFLYSALFIGGILAAFTASQVRD